MREFFTDIIVKRNKEVIDQITYTSNSHNESEIEAFVGGFPECKICGGTGEYETEHGPKGCNLCNSRLLTFIDENGDIGMVDWDETILKHRDGTLSLKKKEDGNES